MKVPAIGLWILLLHALQALGAAESPGLGSGERLLSYPDALQMEMLADRLLGRQPPMDKWAEQVVARQATSEFTDRESLLSAARKPFEAMFADTADIGSLLIRVRSQFSQYDADSKGYYLSAFMPGTILKFSSGKYPGNRVELRLVNLSKVQLWSLEPSLAEAVLKKHPNREVLVDVTVQIVGVRMSSSGPQLEGKVRAYAIYANEMQIAAVQLTD